MGCNYYYNIQWLAGTTDFLPWVNAEGDPRIIPLHMLIENLYNRYKRPIVISETSHPKEDRPQWMTMIAEQCKIVLEKNIPLWGICWYPVVDRPDWDYPQLPWHNAGIWAYHTSFAIAAYIAACAVLSLIATALMTDYTGKDIGGEYHA